ncbi:MAG: oxidoreductase [Acidobacteriota bacterium]
MKTAFVTGASSGIGKATAKQLLKDGYAVYVAARRVEKMRDLEELGATALAMDITVEEQVVAAVERIQQERGGVDVLVNNAGFGMYGAMEDTSIDDARYQFEVNIFGLARLTQLVLPAMRERGAGKIVNISSIGGKIYTPLGSWYHATKHALEGWSDCLRLEVAPFGIDVIIIEPGLIKTEFGDVMMDPMLERSGSTAYGPIAQRLAKAVKESYEGNSGSPPEVISRLISKALKVRRPRTRYAAGQLAKPLLFIRKWTGDRTFDKAVMSQVK